MRIAVQAKGYVESVGNGAVQEALAGMAFYKCQRCAVITNSRFTASRGLAGRINCILMVQLAQESRRVEKGRHAILIGVTFNNLQERKQHVYELTLPCIWGAWLQAQED